MKKTILTIDDDESIREFMKFVLESRGYLVLCARNATEALNEARKRPALVLLDVMMPNVDGWQIAKLLKSHPDTKNIPIIFITASLSIDDEVNGFEVGAYDFITKPFNIEKLIARIKSVLHPYNPADYLPKTLMFNDISLDVSNYLASIGDKSVQFSKKEFELLFFLVRNPNKILSREYLLSNIWGDDSIVMGRTIDVHIRQIRKKLGKRSEYIETLKGVGYRLRLIEKKPKDLKLLMSQQMG